MALRASTVCRYCANAALLWLFILPQISASHDTERLAVKSSAALLPWPNSLRLKPLRLLLDGRLRVAVTLASTCGTLFHLVCLNSSCAASIFLTATCIS